MCGHLWTGGYSYHLLRATNCYGALKLIFLSSGACVECGDIVEVMSGTYSSVPSGVTAIELPVVPVDKFPLLSHSRRR